MVRSFWGGCVVALAVAGMAGLLSRRAWGEEDLAPPLHLDPPQPPPVFATEDVEHNAQKFVTTYLFEHVADHVNKTVKPPVAFGYNDVLLAWDYRESLKAAADAPQGSNFFAVMRELRGAAEDQRSRLAAQALLVFNTLNLAANMPSGPYTEEQRKAIATTLPGMIERIRERAESVEGAEALVRELPAAERKSLADLLLSTADWHAGRVKQLLQAKEELQGKGLLGFALRTEREIDRKSQQVTRLYTYYMPTAGRKVQHGVAAAWHPNGRVESYREYRHGKLHGRSFSWDTEGRATFMAQYAEGQPTGVQRHWYGHGTGQIMIQEVRYLGPQSTAGTTWKGERVVEMVETRGGKTCGTHKTWHDNGKPRVFMTYKDGVTVYERSFYETGRPRCEGALGPQGRTGVWKYWEPDGTLTEKKEGR